MVSKGGWTRVGGGQEPCDILTRRGGVQRGHQARSSPHKPRSSLCVWGDKLWDEEKEDTKSQGVQKRRVIRNVGDLCMGGGGQTRAQATVQKGDTAAGVV